MTPKQASKCRGPMDELLNPELFKSLGDPTRLSLLACLAKCGHPCSVTDLAECCAVDFSVVSRHLTILERAGVVESTKKGRTVLYTVRYQQLCQTLRKLARGIEACCPDGKPAVPEQECLATE